MNIQPRNDLVLIERMESPEISGSILLPQIVREKSLLGKVLAVGPGKMIEGINGGQVRKRPEVKVGDIVYFNSKWNELSGSHYAGEEPVHIPKGLHLVYEADIFLKVTDGYRPD